MPLNREVGSWTGLILVLAALVAAAVLLVACGSEQPTDAPAVAAATATPTPGILTRRKGA